MLHFIDLADAVGVAGFLLYAGTDVALALRWLHSGQIRFFFFTAMAAAMILASLAVDFNMGAFLCESFALGMCAVAIAIRAKGRNNRAGLDAGAAAARPQAGG